MSFKPPEAAFAPDASTSAARPAWFELSPNWSMTSPRYFAASAADRLSAAASCIAARPFAMDEVAVWPALASSSIASAAFAADVPGMLRSEPSSRALAAAITISWPDAPVTAPHFWTARWYSLPSLAICASPETMPPPTTRFRRWWASCRAPSRPRRSCRIDASPSAPTCRRPRRAELESEAMPRSPEAPEPTRPRVRWMASTSRPRERRAPEAPRILESRFAASARICTLSV